MIDPLTSGFEASEFGTVYRQYLAPTYSEEYERKFYEHCQGVGQTLARGAIYFVLAVVVLTWPIDYYLYSDQPRLLQSVNIWRGTGAIVCTLYLLTDALTGLIETYFTEFFFTGFMIMTFSIFYSLGTVGGLDTPWYYSAYCIPFIVLIFFNLRFARRVVYTFGIAATCMVGYFGMHPGHLETAYVGTPLLLTVVFAAASTFIGHVFHNVYKRAFIQSQRLQTSLREKETLLEEIHHRVKNNMQVIMSMLNMHAREEDSEEFDEMFQQIINRVKSMALIHETLYQSEHLSRVSLPEYIRDLSEHLVVTYSQDNEPELVVDVDEADVDMDQAIACGLILNESVTNALEHGLDGTPGDRVEVTFRRTDDDRATLEISDNGAGFENNFPEEDTSSTGVFLIRSLAGYELDGTVDFLDGDGVTVTVRFEL